MANEFLDADTELDTERYGIAPVAYLDSVIGGDALPPTVENLVPANLSTITVDQAIVFDVLDETALAFYDVLVEFADGVYEVIWDGAKFSAQYSAGSSRVAIGGGYRFSVVRGGTGWLRGPSFRVNVVDAGGNVSGDDPV